jgi:hypothetical protein
MERIWSAFMTSASCTQCYPCGFMSSRAGGSETRPMLWPPGAVPSHWRTRPALL